MHSISTPAIYIYFQQQGQEVMEGKSYFVQTMAVLFFNMIE